VLTAADLRAFLERAAGTFGDRTVSVRVKDEGTFASLVSVHAVLVRGELWLFDGGETFIYLRSVGAPAIDEGAVRAICNEHGAEFAMSVAGEPWITRRLDEYEALPAALGELETAISALIMASGIYGVDPKMVSPTASHDMEQR
jgi:hypothetical protein